MAFDEFTARKGINSPFEATIQAAAAANGVDPSLIKGIISVESGWNPNAINQTSGCVGLMQLNTHYWGTQEELLNPERNINLGAQIIGTQLRRLGALDLALAAYNAGTSRLAEDLAQRVKTNALGVGDYVINVTNYYRWFSQQAAQPTDIIDVGGGGVALPSWPEQSDLYLMVGAALLLGLVLWWGGRRG